MRSSTPGTAPARAQNFFTCVFRLTTARAYSAATALAQYLLAAKQHGEKAETTELARLRESARHEHQHNIETERKLWGAPVTYGRVPVQLVHEETGKVLTVRPFSVARTQKDCTLLELDDIGTQYSQFVFVPRYKHRRPGDFVRTLYVAEAKLATLRVARVSHNACCCRDRVALRTMTNMYVHINPTTHEINVSSRQGAESEWTFDKYAKHTAAKHSEFLRSGQFVRLFHFDTNSFLLCGGSTILNGGSAASSLGNRAADKQRVSVASQSQQAEYPVELLRRDDDVMRTGDDDPRNSALGLWQIETERISEGGTLSWGQRVRLRHVCSGLYLHAAAPAVDIVKRRRASQRRERSASSFSTSRGGPLPTVVGAGSDSDEVCTDGSDSDDSGHTKGDGIENLASITLAPFPTDNAVFSLHDADRAGVTGQPVTYLNSGVRLRHEETGRWLHCIDADRLIAGEGFRNKLRVGSPTVGSPLAAARERAKDDDDEDDAQEHEAAPVRAPAMPEKPLTAAAVRDAALGPSELIGTVTGNTAIAARTARLRAAFLARKIIPNVGFSEMWQASSDTASTGELADANDGLVDDSGAPPSRGKAQRSRSASSYRNSSRFSTSHQRISVSRLQAEQSGPPLSFVGFSELPYEQDAFRLAPVPEAQIRDTATLAAQLPCLHHYVQTVSAAQTISDEQLGSVQRSLNALVAFCTQSDLSVVQAAAVAGERHLDSDMLTIRHRQRLLREQGGLGLLMRMIQCPFSKWGGQYDLEELRLQRRRRPHPLTVLRRAMRTSTALRGTMRAAVEQIEPIDTSAASGGEEDDRRGGTPTGEDAKRMIVDAGSNRLSRRPLSPTQHEDPEKSLPPQLLLCQRVCRWCYKVLRFFFKNYRENEVLVSRMKDTFFFQLGCDLNAEAMLTDLFTSNLSLIECVTPKDIARVIFAIRKTGRRPQYLNFLASVCAVSAAGSKEESIGVPSKQNVIASALFGSLTVYSSVEGVSNAEDLGSRHVGASSLSAAAGRRPRRSFNVTAKELQGTGMDVVLPVRSVISPRRDQAGIEVFVGALPRLDEFLSSPLALRGSGGDKTPQDRYSEYVAKLLRDFQFLWVDILELYRLASSDDNSDIGDKAVAPVGDDVLDAPKRPKDGAAAVDPKAFSGSGNGVGRPALAHRPDLSDATNTHHSPLRKESSLRDLKGNLPSSDTGDRVADLIKYAGQSMQDVADYVTAQVSLCGELCVGRNSRSTAVVRSMFSRECLLRCVRAPEDGGSPLPDDARSAFGRLLLVAFVDIWPLHPLPIVELSRPWKQDRPSGTSTAGTAEIGLGSTEAVQLAEDQRRFFGVLHRDAVTHLIAARGRLQVHSREQNMLTLNYLRIVWKLMIFGVIQSPAAVAEVAEPVIMLLDDRTDEVLETSASGSHKSFYAKSSVKFAIDEAHELLPSLREAMREVAREHHRHPSESERTTTLADDENTVVRMNCKLVACKILRHVTRLQLEVQLQGVLDAFRENAEAFRVARKRGDLAHAELRVQSFASARTHSGALTSFRGQRRVSASPSRGLARASDADSQAADASEEARAACIQAAHLAMKTDVYAAQKMCATDIVVVLLGLLVNARDELKSAILDLLRLVFGTHSTALRALSNTQLLTEPRSIAALHSLRTILLPDLRQLVGSSEEWMSELTVAAAHSNRCAQYILAVLTDMMWSTFDDYGDLPADAVQRKGGLPADEDADEIAAAGASLGALEKRYGKRRRRIASDLGTPCRERQIMVGHAGVQGLVLRLLEDATALLNIWRESSSELAQQMVGRMKSLFVTINGFLRTFCAGLPSHQRLLMAYVDLFLAHAREGIISVAIFEAIFRDNLNLCRDSAGAELLEEFVQMLVERRGHAAYLAPLHAVLVARGQVIFNNQVLVMRMLMERLEDVLEGFLYYDEGKLGCERVIMLASQPRVRTLLRRYMLYDPSFGPSTIQSVAEPFLMSARMDPELPVAGRASVIGGPSHDEAVNMRTHVRPDTEEDAVVLRDLQYHVRLLELLSVLSSGENFEVEAMAQGLLPFGAILEALDRQDLPLELRVPLHLFAHHVWIDTDAPPAEVNTPETMNALVKQLQYVLRLVRESRDAMWRLSQLSDDVEYPATDIFRRLSAVEVDSHRIYIWRRDRALSLKYLFDCVLPSVVALLQAPRMVEQPSRVARDSGPGARIDEPAADTRIGIIELAADTLATIECFATKPLAPQLRTVWMEALLRREVEQLAIALHVVDNAPHLSMLSGRAARIKEKLALNDNAWVKKRLKQHDRELQMSKGLKVMSPAAMDRAGSRSIDDDPGGEGDAESKADSPQLTKIRGRSDSRMDVLARYRSEGPGETPELQKLESNAVDSFHMFVDTLRSDEGFHSSVSAEFEGLLNAIVQADENSTDDLVALRRADTALLEKGSWAGHGSLLHMNRSMRVAPHDMSAGSLPVPKSHALILGPSPSSRGAGISCERLVKALIDYARATTDDSRGMILVQRVLQSLVGKASQVGPSIRRAVQHRLVKLGAAAMVVEHISTSTDHDAEVSNIVVETATALLEGGNADVQAVFCHLLRTGDGNFLRRIAQRMLRVEVDVADLKTCDELDGGVVNAVRQRRDVPSDEDTDDSEAEEIVDIQEVDDAALLATGKLKGSDSEPDSDKPVPRKVVRVRHVLSDDDGDDAASSNDDRLSDDDVADEVLPVTAHELASLTSLFRCLQSLCEGHFLPLQNLLRQQQVVSSRNDAGSDSQKPSTMSSVDLVSLSVYVLHTLHDKLSAYTIGLISQIIDTLIEFCQGPCPENQSALVHGGLVEVLSQLLTYTLNAREEQLDSVSGPGSRDELQRRCLVCLAALMEGRSDALVHERLIMLLDLRLLKVIITRSFVAFMVYHDGRYEERAFNSVFVSDDPMLDSSSSLFSLPPEERGGRMAGTANLDLGFAAMALLRTLMEHNPQQLRHVLPVHAETKMNRFAAVLRTGDANLEHDKRLAEQHRVSYSHAFRFFAEHMERVEIVRNGSLETIFFPVPPMAYFLSGRSKDELTWGVERDNPTRKIQDFISRYPALVREMNHNEGLRRRMPSSRSFMGWLLDVEIVSGIGFAIILVINLLMVGCFEGVDSGPEERHVAVCSTRLFSWETNIDWAFIIRVLGVILATVGSHALVLSLLTRGLLVGSDAYERYAKRSDEAELGYRRRIEGGQAGVGAPSHSRHGNMRSLRHLLEAQQRSGETASPNTSWASRIGRNIVFILFAMTHREFLYLAAYIAGAVCGVVAHPFFFAFHLLDVTKRYQELSLVLRAVSRPRRALVLTLCLFLILTYFFSLVGFRAFRGEFRDEAACEEAMMDDPAAAETDPRCTGQCSTLFRCFFQSLDFGFKNDGGIGGGLVDPSGYSGLLWGARLLYDNLFNAMLMIILLNIVAGIIIDTFASLRDMRKAKQEDMLGVCFICSIDRATFDRYTDAGFDHHIKNEHNLWAYLHLIVYVHFKEHTELTGPEEYVKKKLKSKDISFFPINRAMSLRESNVSARVGDLNARPGASRGAAGGPQSHDRRGGDAWQGENGGNAILERRLTALEKALDRIADKLDVDASDAGTVPAGVSSPTARGF